MSLDMESTNPQNARHFYIFGKNISASMSPAIHNTGYKYHGLKHQYAIKELDDITTCEPLIRASSFGGASVTMPYKLQVSRYCDSISEEARAIGAINTLTRAEDGTTIGDNTDWSGLVNCIAEHYPSHAAQPPAVGWVLGAGGAARAALYALHKSGVPRIFLSNRTKSHAEKIVSDFSEIFAIEFVDDWTEMNEHPADVVIGTIPAETVSDDQFRGVTWKPEGGLCIDMSYKPRVTPLLRIAQKQGWSVANGLEVLLEQGYIQFRKWTGLEAPKGLVREAVGVPPIRANGGRL